MKHSKLNSIKKSFCIKKNQTILNKNDSINKHGANRTRKGVHKDKYEIGTTCK